MTVCRFAVCIRIATCINFVFLYVYMFPVYLRVRRWHYSNHWFLFKLFFPNVLLHIIRSHNNCQLWKYKDKEKEEDIVEDLSK